jgi:transposase
MRTGASWREVPARFAPWHTVYDRHARWRRDGTWARILAVLLPPEPAT